jgi:large subunit ribosomal protein L25
MADVLEVENREKMGTAASRRLRQAGRVPAVLYGHGEETTHLSVSEPQVRAMLRHHSQTVTLAGAIKETALVREVQYDPLGIEVLHLDLVRVNLKELVEVTVPIYQQGEAAGLREGGVLLENLHDVDIRCPAGQIPEQLVLNVTDLHVGGQLTAGDLELPEGVELITPAETVVAHVEEPKEQLEEVGEEGAGAEPELISKGGESAEEEED